MIGSLLYHPGTVGLVFAQPSIEVVKAIGCRPFGSPAPTNEAKEANQSICETKALETCDEAAPFE